MIDTKTQLCQACHPTKRIQSARIYANRLFLPKMEQEKLERKAVTWTFYCGRQSGDLPIYEDNFIKLKEYFFDSARGVSVIPTLFFNLLNLFFNNYGPFGWSSRISLKWKNGGIFVASAKATSRIQSRFRSRSAANGFIVRKYDSQVPTNGHSGFSVVPPSIIHDFATTFSKFISIFQLLYIKKSLYIHSKH
jgi:hypothetical protein